MSPQEYDYLRQFLKTRSGLVLSNEKQYLIESRLLPVARKAGLQSIGALVAKLKEPGEAMLAEAADRAGAQSNAATAAAAESSRFPWRPFRLSQAAMA